MGKEDFCYIRYHGGVFFDKKDYSILCSDVNREDKEVQM